MPTPDKENRQIHYIHRMSYTMQERLVGIFVLLALSVIFILFFINSRTAHLFEDTITLHAYLKKAEGISTETPVKISGIEVGKVEDLDISEDHRIHLTLIVYQRYHPLIRSDSKAAVGKLSVFGRSVIDIAAGSPEKPLLPDGSTIMVEEPMSVDELIAELTPVVQAVESSVQRFAALIEAVEPKKVEGMVGDLSTSAENIRLMSEQLNSRNGALGTLLYDEKLAKDLTSAVGAIDTTFTQADKVVKDLQPLVKNLDQGTANLPQVMGEVQTMLNNANATLTTVNVELKQLPDLITRMNVLMEETDRLIEGINNSWLFSSEESQQRRKLIGVQPYHE